MKLLRLILVCLLGPSQFVWGQCPWSRDVQLQSSCVCNASQNEGFNAISIQCQAVNFPKLMLALRTYTTDTIIENLYVSNTTVASLTDFVFKNLKIISLHFTGNVVIFYCIDQLCITSRI